MTEKMLAEVGKVYTDSVYPVGQVLDIEQRKYVFGCVAVGKIFPKFHAGHIEYDGTATMGSTKNVNIVSVAEFMVSSVAQYGWFLIGNSTGDPVAVYDNFNTSASGTASAAASARGNFFTTALLSGIASSTGAGSGTQAWAIGDPLALAYTSTAIVSTSISGGKVNDVAITAVATASVTTDTETKLAALSVAIALAQNTNLYSNATAQHLSYVTSYPAGKFQIWGATGITASGALGSTNIRTLLLPDDYIMILMPFSGGYSAEFHNVTSVATATNGTTGVLSDAFGSAFLGISATSVKVQPEIHVFRKTVQSIFQY